MRWFISGHLVVLLAICGWNLRSDIWPTVSSDGPYWNGKESVRLLLVMVAMPTLASAGVTLLLNQLRPRRMFDGALSRRSMPFALGAMTAILALAAVPLLIVFGSFDEKLGDAGLLASCSATMTFLMLIIFTRQRKAGLCIQCDYDIRGSLNTGRCPECGMAI